MAVKASAHITLHSVVDIQATYRYYLLQSSTLSKPAKPTTNPPSSSWDDTEPTYTSGSTNSLYYVDLTVFSNGTFKYSEVSLSTAYEAAKEAYNKAQNAQNSADQAQSDIDNLEIGGRNLLANSNFLFERTKDDSSFYQSTYNVVQEYDLQSLIGKQLTVSVFIHSPGSRESATDSNTVMNNRFGIHGLICWSDSTGVNTTLYNRYPFSSLLEIVADRQRFSSTYTVTPPSGYDTIEYVLISVQQYAKPASDNDETWLLGYPKLEIGNKPTDWTPAPEDMVTNDELTTNYYTKVDTDAKLDITKESITSTVSATYATKTALSTVDNKIANLEIGGRNLIADSYINETSSRYGFGKRVLAAALEPNTEYVFTVNGRTNDDKTSDDGRYLVVFIYDVGWSVFKNSIAIKETVDTTRSIVFTTPEGVESVEFEVQGFYYPSSDESTGTVTLNWVKLEKGNKATDWTPAPEDLEEATATAQDTAETAQQSADSVGEKVFTVESVVTQLAESISSLVRGQNGESLMTQTENGWTFNITSIQNTLNTATQNISSLNSDMSSTNSMIDALNDSVADLGVYTEYIKFGVDNGKPCIILGETDSTFKVVITNTEIRFMEGSAVPAYISNQSLNIEKAVISDELKQGGFVWMARENGNYGLLWKGE